LVVGKQGTKPVLLTLVERKSRKSLYVLVKNKPQKEIVAAIKRVRRRVGVRSLVLCILPIAQNRAKIFSRAVRRSTAYRPSRLNNAALSPYCGERRALKY